MEIFDLKLFFLWMISLQDVEIFRSSGTGRSQISLADLFLESSKESSSRAGLALDATDGSVLVVVQEGADSLVGVNLDKEA